MTSLNDASKDYLVYLLGPGDKFSVREEPTQSRIVTAAGDGSFNLRMTATQVLCVRSALIELAEKKHPTTDWPGARFLYDQITEELK